MGIGVEKQERGVGHVERARCHPKFREWGLSLKSMAESSSGCLYV